MSERLESRQSVLSSNERHMALKVAHNEHVVTLFFARVKFAVKSQGARGNKRINITTIENGE